MMAVKEKRAKFMKDLIKFMNIMDPSGDNAKSYQEKFDGMSDAAFDKYIKEFFNDDKKNFYLEVIEYDRDLTFDNIEKCAKEFNIPLFERVIIPYINPDGPAFVTPYPVAVGYIHEKRMQQTLLKKNKGSIYNQKRNVLTGQVSGEDRNSRISDSEMYGLSALNANATLMEFLGPRADDEKARLEMADRIAATGSVSLKELSNDPKNKTSVRTLNAYFAMQGISTNLLHPENELMHDDKLD
jgi:hypothetical protein